MPDSLKNIFMFIKIWAFLNQEGLLCIAKMNTSFYPEHYILQNSHFARTAGRMRGDNLYSRALLLN